MNKNGFTLVELMIVVAIVGILATVGYNGLSEQGKRTAVNDNKIIIPTIFRNILEKSFQEGKSYTITFDQSVSNDPHIKVTNSNGATVGDTKLSNKLDYMVVTSTSSGVGVTTAVINVNEQGFFDIDGNGQCDIGESFTITVKDKQNANKLMVEGKNISAVRVGKIDVSTPNGSGWSKQKGM